MKFILCCLYNWQEYCDACEPNVADNAKSQQVKHFAFQQMEEIERGFNDCQQTQAIHAGEANLQYRKFDTNYDECTLSDSTSTSWMNFVPTDSEARFSEASSDASSYDYSDPEYEDKLRQRRLDKERALEREYAKDKLILPTWRAFQTHNSILNYRSIPYRLTKRNHSNINTYNADKLMKYLQIMHTQSKFNVEISCIMLMFLADD